MARLVPRPGYPLVVLSVAFEKKAAPPGYRCYPSRSSIAIGTFVPKQ